MYSLHRPSAIGLHNEMLRVGATHYGQSRAAYLHLLLEALMVVVTRYYWQTLGHHKKETLLHEEEEKELEKEEGSGIEECMKQKMAGKRLEEMEKDTLLLDSPRKVNKVENKQSKAEKTKVLTKKKKFVQEEATKIIKEVAKDSAEGNCEDLKALMKESFLRIADFYASEGSELEWQWSLVRIYQGFEIPLPDVISRLSSLEANTDDAIVYTLTNMLINPEIHELTAPESNFVLDTLIKLSPGRVSEILLRSDRIKEHKKEKALSALKKELSKHSSPRPCDVLALAVIILEKGSPEQVATVLGLLKAHHLFQVLQQYISLLIHDVAPPEDVNSSGCSSLSSTSLTSPSSSTPNTPRVAVVLTPLALVLLDHKWDIFCDLFLSVIGNDGKISLDTFCLAMMDARPIVTCGPECNVNSLRLRDFLETYFVEYAYSITQSYDEKSEVMTKSPNNYERSVSVLVSLYLASLLGAFAAKTKDEIMREEPRQCLEEVYGPRPPYLNLLPPFGSKKPGDGCSPMKTPALQSSERKKCVDLLILQSLLSSSLPSSSDRQNVIKFAKGNPSLKGSDGLLAAALTGHQQMNFVLTKYPEAFIIWAKVKKTLIFLSIVVGNFNS